ncbi:MAG: hypothetical protein HYZ75_04185 [Elusimicrobia bacterium]|nr:hypothetical protein [Elusimicrobiota bacterium]
MNLKTIAACVGALGLVLSAAAPARAYCGVHWDAAGGFLSVRFQQDPSRFIFDAMADVPARSAGSGVIKEGAHMTCWTGSGIWGCSVAMTTDGALAQYTGTNVGTQCYVEVGAAPDGLTLTFLNSRITGASRRVVEGVYNSMSGVAETVNGGSRTRAGAAMSCTVVERGPGRSSCRVTVARDGRGTVPPTPISSTESASEAVERTSAAVARGAGAVKGFLGTNPFLAR